MAKKSDRKALGRGLSALLGDSAVATAAPVSLGNLAGSTTETDVAGIPIDLIHANARQPRQRFEDADLRELASSIREHGVLQPILVRPLAERDGHFEIVAGERRWRAAQIAGIHTLPAIVRDIDETKVLELAIIENVQRVDLDPIEEAAGYTQLIENFGYTQEQLSKVIGKSRSHLANVMRLLSLPRAVTDLVQQGSLSSGHARALITASDPVGLARKAVAEGLSVRSIEKLAKAGPPSKRPAPAERAAKDADTRLLEGDLSAATGMKVSIESIAPDGSGELRIRYKSLDQLDELCRKLTN